MWEDVAFGNYIAGQADADSTFYLRINVQKVHKYGLSAQCFWSVTKFNDKDILLKMKDFLNLGRVYQVNRSNVKRKTGYQLMVTGTECLKLIEFFDKFTLRGSKLNDYKLWREAVQIRYQHPVRTRLEREALVKLLKIKIEMFGRVRGTPRYSVDFFKNLISQLESNSRKVSLEES